MPGFLKSFFSSINKIPYWILFAIFLIGVELIVQPFGNYPLNDDWAYAKAVSDYLKSGKIIYSDEIAIPFLAQFFIGIVVSKFIGFSFLKLRLISLIFSGLSIYVANTIAKTLGLNRRHTIIFLLLLTANPLYLTLQNTFLPEIFILFFALCTVNWMLLYLNDGKNFHYFLFVLFCVLGSTSRQSSFLIPFIFGLIYIFQFGSSFKKFFIAFLPFGLSIFSLVLFQAIAQKNGFLPSNYNLQLSALIRNIKHQPFHLLINTSYYFLTSLICLGLFILPLVLMNIKSIIQLIKNSLAYQITLFFVLFILCLKVVLSAYSQPFVGNIFYSRGIGPIILTGFNSDTYFENSGVISFIFKILSFLGGISFYAFVIVVISNFKSVSIKIKWFYYFVLLLTVSYLVLISLNYANDRYLLFVLPFILLIAIQNFQLKLKVFIPLLVVMILFSSSIVSTYFKINDAKWEALNYLTHSKLISPKQIDGGYEFNSYYNAHDPKSKINDKERWWWIVDDEYIVTPMSQRNNYKVEKEILIKNTLFLPFRSIKILKREN